MNKKITSLLFGILMSVIVAASALAADAYVYVTKNGKKYHNAESRFIKNKETEKITLEEAKSRGLEPSSAYLKYMESQVQEPVKDK